MVVRVVREREGVMVQVAFTDDIRLLHSNTMGESYVIQYSNRTRFRRLYCSYSLLLSYSSLQLYNPHLYYLSL